MKPEFLPMTSTMNTRSWLMAVSRILSMASTAVSMAVSNPMVSSVPLISLSMVAGMEMTGMPRRLMAVPAITQLPIGAESDFVGVVDLVEMNAKTYRGETEMGQHYEVEEIPADMLEQAQEWRAKLVETIAENDDAA